MLVDLVNDPTAPADQIRFAAQQLLPFDSAPLPCPPRVTAANALRRIAEDRTLDPHGRRRAAQALTQFGPSPGPNPLDILAQLAADPDIPPLQRALAHADLATLHPTQRPAAARALLAVARDTTEPTNHRRRAAEQLTSLANATRADGVALLRALTIDTSTSPDERALAAHAIARQDATHRRTAAAALTELDTTLLDANQRRRTVEAWAQRCPEHLPDATTCLRKLITDPINPPSGRRRAAAALARVLGRPGRVVASPAETDGNPESSPINR